MRSRGSRSRSGRSWRNRTLNTKAVRIIQILLCSVVSLILAVLGIRFIASNDNAKTYNVEFSAIKQTEDDDAAHLLLRGLSLRKGTYDVVIGYVADDTATLDISLDNDTYLSEEMPATGDGAGLKSYTFEIATGTDRGKIDFTYPKGSKLSLAYITISSEKPLYNDSLISGIILLLLIPCVWLGRYFFARSTHKVSLIIAIGVVIVQMLPFILSDGLRMGIDTRAHMMRIEGIFYGLLDGQFPVVVCPEWNNSYGQIGVLYPNVFLYIPAIFRLMGMSQLGAFKLFMFLGITGSALIALASARTIFKREWQICLAVIIICLDDMHMFNMLGDGRFGGAFIAEMFYPLVIAGLIELFYQNRNKYYLLAYGIAGVVCSHIMSATIVCLVVAVFAAISYRKFRDKTTIGLTVRAFVLFIGLILGPMVCFVKFYFSDWGQEKLQWEDFTSTLWPRGYFPDDIRWAFAITLILICGICIAVLAKRGKLDLIKNTFVTPALVCALIMFWMSTAAFPWKLLGRIEFFKYYSNMLQDAYRFLTLTSAFLAFCVPKLIEAVVVSIEGRRTYKSKTAIASAVAIVTLCIAYYVSANNQFFRENDDMLYFDPVIGEVEYQLDDYLPAGTQSDWYKSDAGFISDEGAITSLAYERAGTYVYYSYTNGKEGAYVEFPRFYYDGYVAEDEMAENVEVYKGDHNRTRVYLKKTDTPAIIRLWYHVPWYMTLTCAISFGLWIGSLMIVAARVYRRMD